MAAGADRPEDSEAHYKAQRSKGVVHARAQTTLASPSFPPISADTMSKESSEIKLTSEFARRAGLVKDEEGRFTSGASATSATLPVGVSDSILKKSHFNDLIGESLKGSLVTQAQS